MGGQPQFALSRQPQPQNPHVSGHYLTYPISTHMLQSGITPNFEVGDGATSFDFINAEFDPVGTLPNFEVSSPNLSWIDPVVNDAFSPIQAFDTLEFDQTVMPTMPELNPLPE